MIHFYVIINEKCELIIFFSKRHSKSFKVKDQVKLIYKF